ncbi:outer membrane protein, partial [Klebsiella pneumoniae]|uniref:outer membrane protein n=1 Tax=Klebsiella pneumoniae TaxID=573 RepID=UPI0021650AF7
MASAHAFSASQPGFYMSAKAGAGLLKTTDNSLQGSGMTAGALSYNIEKENLKNITDTVFSPGIAVGYQFTGDTYQPVRVELAYQHYGKQDDTMSFSPSVSGYWHNQKNNTFPLPSESSLYMKTKAGTLMVNVYYDIPVNNDISAYLMAGAGAAFIRND